MKVSLNQDVEQFIHSQVKIGKYTSTDEVIVAGIKLLEEKERIYKGRFEEMRREVAVGVEASTRGEVIDGETVFRELQQKLSLVNKQPNE